MSYANIFGIAVVVAGFLLAAAISEYSLRGADASTQGYLLKSLTPFRKVHLLGIPAILVLAFFFPKFAWVGAFAYFGAVSCFAIAKIWRLELPTRLRNLQAASVGSVLVSILLAAVVSHAL